MRPGNKKHYSRVHHVTSYTEHAIYLDKIKHFQNGYDKKEINFFQKRFLIKLRCVICICGFYGSANMGAAGQIVAKMNKTGHCPSWFFQPHPTPSKETVPTQAPGDTASCHLSMLWGPAGERLGRQPRALILKVWPSPQPHQLHLETSGMPIPRPHPGLQNQKL